MRENRKNTDITRNETEVNLLLGLLPKCRSRLACQYIYKLLYTLLVLTVIVYLLNIFLLTPSFQLYSKS